jgi:hypothetical protein
MAQAVSHQPLTVEADITDQAFLYKTMNGFR